MLSVPLSVLDRSRTRVGESEAEPGGLGGQCGQQGPALEYVAVLLAGEREEVVPEPGVADLRHLVGLQPDAADVGVRDVHRGGLQTEGE
jgi:hypothetical protein